VFIASPVNEYIYISFREVPQTYHALVGFFFLKQRACRPGAIR